MTTDAIQPILPILIYECRNHPNGSDDFRFFGCFHGKARGEPIPVDTCGATVHEACDLLFSRHRHEQPDILHFECEKPPSKRLRYIAFSPAIEDQFFFAGPTEEGVRQKMVEWWSAVQAREAERKDNRLNKIEVVGPDGVKLLILRDEIDDYEFKGYERTDKRAQAAVKRASLARIARGEKPKGM